MTPPPPSAPSRLPINFAHRRELTRDLAISFLMQQAVENPDVISLAAGLVDYETLPLSEVHAAVGELMSDARSGRQALQYGTTPGHEPLRKLLLSHFSALERRDTGSIGIDSNQLIVTTGSQQLLSLVCEVLFDPGDICLVAGPTYFVFAGNLAGVGARSVTIRTDESGMLPEALDEALAEIAQLEELERVKLIYVVSYYDNPSGVCVSTERRKQIVEIVRKWSREHRILILEDAAYRELRYDGPEFPSLWSFDDSGEHVIYTQTFSKTFSPGVRVGFGIVPQDLIQPLTDRKGNEDFGSANLNQHLMATVLENGSYATHLESVRQGYVAKRNAMLSAAEEFCAELPGVRWHHPHGGLYVWMSLPPGISTGFNGSLFQTAVKQGVMYVPGELCYASAAIRPRNEMRLSFGVQSPEGIREGIRRLSIAIQTVSGSSAQ